MSFYCSEKFTFLTVDIEKRLLYSCCSADPEKINIKWLEQNSTQLFNTPLLQLERQSMLNNVPVASCEKNCWQSERNNITSRRIWLKTDRITHTNIQTKSPTRLNINLGSTCNLTCSYCCKQYSSAWRRDIINNGSYIDQNRFNPSPQDHILLKISHNDHMNDSAYKLIVDEIKTFDQVKEIVISGGEPFLYNNLIDLLDRFPNINTHVYTSLGVNQTRFKKQLEKIKNRDNIKIIVSAENCNQLYEFNRYGNSWDQFLQNLKELQNQKFQVKFASVISNLTVFGLSEFKDQFSDFNIRYSWCNEPDFLSVNVLDDESKEQLITQFESSNFQIKDQLISSIKAPYTEQQRSNLLTYITKFALRRNLSLAIYPKSMLQWLKLQ